MPQISPQAERLSEDVTTGARHASPVPQTIPQEVERFSDETHALPWLPFSVTAVLAAIGALILALLAAVVPVAAEGPEIVWVPLLAIMMLLVGLFVALFIVECRHRQRHRRHAVRSSLVMDVQQAV